MTSATLVVVPATLLSHWQNQIARHTRKPGLRVYVVHDRRSALIPGYELANFYDVVLTTFDRLSSDWRPELRSQSVLLKVRSLS